eukprot:SAG31_NODE_1455_length_8278_cov_2.514366_7_plen_58_part_00
MYLHTYLCALMDYGKAKGVSKYVYLPTILARAPRAEARALYRNYLKLDRTGGTVIPG